MEEAEEFGESDESDESEVEQECSLLETLADW